MKIILIIFIFLNIINFIPKKKGICNKISFLIKNVNNFRPFGGRGSKALSHIYLKGNFDFRFKLLILYENLLLSCSYIVHPWIILCQRFRNKTNKGLIFVHICLSCFCVMNLILNIFGVYFQYITNLCCTLYKFTSGRLNLYDICMSCV